MSTTNEREPTLRLEIAIRPRWRNVELVRTGVLACVAAIAEGTETETIGVVASELVENAIRYGGWEDEERACLRLRIVSDGDSIEVAVSNPAGPNPEHFAALEKTLDWIRSFPAPGDAYLARMRTILQEDAEGSHMGLLRIVREGPCTVTAEKSADSKYVLVRAMMRLDDA